MAASPRISIRLSDDMHARLLTEAESAGKPPSIFARELLAKALKQKGLAAIRPMGRPKISEKI